MIEPPSPCAGSAGIGVGSPVAIRSSTCSAHGRRALPTTIQLRTLDAPDRTSATVPRKASLTTTARASEWSRMRSEERRVGKECRSRWGPEQEKKQRDRYRERRRDG